MIRNKDMADMFYMVNDERQKHGLYPFTWNSKLATVSYYHCQDQMREGGLFHQSKTTGSVADRLNSYGLDYKAVGENCAFGNKKIWSLKYCGKVAYLNKNLFLSPSHAKNLLSTDFKEIGIAIIDDMINSQGYANAIYITQVFRL